MVESLVVFGMSCSLCFVGWVLILVGSCVVLIGTSFGLVFRLKFEDE